MGQIRIMIIRVAPLPTPPVENAIKQTIAYVINDAIKSKFTGTPRNIPLNAVMFAYEVIGYPICWNGAIPVDCYIEVNGHVRININPNGNHMTQYPR
ncbi:MAG: hypothetical protein EZS28_011883 [Streblomastix strix]|uniref:Uncharacterized protein n=1 Tax=Streblomastix strix TaxID=222440 RepID=A0A5J4WCN6_9EUKA|nr:MAG: hypothetical protein EZS28_011883 [Streblomastix strix]